MVYVPVRFYKERDTIISHALTLTLTSASAMTMSVSATPIHHVTHIPCNSSWFSAEAECSNTRAKSRETTQYPTAHDVAPTRVDMQVSAVLLCELRQDEGTPQDGTQCKVKATGGCHVCKRIWALLQIHAKQCKQENCPVPNCMAIRERYRQLQLQQQAMDDRRRQMMNQTYHQDAR